MSRGDVLAFVLIALFLVGVCWYFEAEKQGHLVNCDVAEFSPDYPPEVKQACRIRRAENNR
jgi:hypothetical protein